MRRRRFMTTMGAAAAVGGGIGFGLLRNPGSAHAGWGAWPSDKMDALLPADRRAKRVLEVHLYGGVNAFDTFYTVPTWGQSDQTYLNAYRGDTEDWFSTQCGYGNVGELTEPFADDGLGTTVHLGPWLLPLRQRPDIVSRMRVLVTRHEQLAHEGANPVALSGSRLGSSRLAGVGAAIQRHFLERPDGLRATPYAYVLYPGAEFPTDNVRAASAVGLHPGTATPLSITVSANSQLAELLARQGTNGYEQEFDAAMSYYVSDYRRRFRHRGRGNPLRSQSRSNFEFADFTRKNAGAIESVLDPSLFVPETGNSCGRVELDTPRMQLELAANLLTRASDEARYVQVVDAGLRPHPSAGYDTHDRHVEFSAQNLPHSLQRVADIINAPGEGDPNKLDLDDTMIVLNTEFGRTPTRQGASGLNHWPQGYATVIIGGPITPAEQGIVGYIDESDGIAKKWMTPAELRMSIMVAMGIYPFSSQTFAVSDVLGGVKDELEAATRIKEMYLGITG